MKLTIIPTPATPWLASLSGSAVVHTAGRAIAPMTPATLGLMVDGAAKLRHEKTARVQAALGSAAFAYATPVMVTDRPAVFGRPGSDPQTTSSANGGVQGPPPWRQPVIT
ncbi:hypothetical protein [Sphaerisporangium corydalis]|uniref:Uncharacterized protein n=1 Tax=Sphaerisporangium corydalis TaxID=1441875 RepID=A0ABV9EG69_9ACTN|nr:hypothetical protein [Sphaerisporangium corydalis]